MATTEKSPPANAPAEISIDYVFDAPRQVVFDNWLEPELVAAWFAPAGYSVTLCEVDARPGGSWRVEYRNERGDAHAEHGEFLEVVAPEALEFTLTQADSHGNVGPRTTVRATFAEQGQKTALHFVQRGFDSARQRDANASGWQECLDKLAHALGLRAGDTPSATDQAGERELRALFETWWRDASAKDIDGAMAPIAQTVVSYEHEAPLEYAGIEAVRGVCQRGFDAVAGKFCWDVPDLQVLVRGDLAVAWGLNRMQSEQILWSRGTRVFRKIAGRWQMIHQHVSFPFDPETGKVSFDLEPQQALRVAARGRSGC